MVVQPRHIAQRQPGYIFSAGFVKNRNIRRILTLSGYDLRLGLPGTKDHILVWGHTKYAKRGAWVARRTGAKIIRVEDAFLRSLWPGRSGEGPVGLLIDEDGAYFDASRPSGLEQILQHDPLDDPGLLARAHQCIDQMQAAHLTKYCALRPDLTPPISDYVLVIDQRRGDASIRLGHANQDTFAHMLHQAQHDHPDAHILIKTHPDTQARHRAGHFARALQSDKIHFVDTPISPWVLFQHARAVYTVSSQMGFEAILAGHRPVTFGAPFYAGWGLSDDRGDVPARRNRALTALQLAAATLILYPKWYDPYRDCLCSVENVIQTLAAQARAWREDRQGYTAYGMRYWKRRHLNNSFGRFKPIRFAKTLKHAAKPGPAVLVWARHASPALEQACADAARPLMRVEDGFLRSRGLGAALTPALSFVKDASGIYYDPTRPSDLETQIATIAHWPHTRLGRAKTLLDALIAHDVTKYNLPTGPSTFRPNTTGSNTTGPVILVPGQVEDDASVMLGGGDIRRNLDLLKQARHLFPDGYLIYKPHPDVEAGLRHGAIAAQDLNQLADHVAHDANPADLMRIADHVVTITSTMGFEALLRGIPVTTLGVPFYAGWGLTTDLGPVPARRTARPSRAALVQAVLIEYPRYFDPVTGLPCPVEIVVDRLTTGKGLTPPPRLRWLSRIQGALANHSWIWR